MMYDFLDGLATSMPHIRYFEEAYKQPNLIIDDNVDASLEMSGYASNAALQSMPWLTSGLSVGGHAIQRATSNSLLQNTRTLLNSQGTFNIDNVRRSTNLSLAAKLGLGVVGSMNERMQEDPSYNPIPSMTALTLTGIGGGAAYQFGKNVMHWNKRQYNDFNFKTKSPGRMQNNAMQSLSGLSTGFKGVADDILGHAQKANWVGLGLDLFETAGASIRALNNRNYQVVDGRMNMNARYDKATTKLYEGSEMTQRNRMDLNNRVSEIVHFTQSQTYQKNSNQFAYDK